jgi:hypothetical protein
LSDHDSAFSFKHGDMSFGHPPDEELRAQTDDDGDAK